MDTRDIKTATLIRCRGLTPVPVGLVYISIYVIGILVGGLHFLHHNGACNYATLPYLDQDNLRDKLQPAGIIDFYFKLRFYL